jgi:transcriptional regulator with XRE-family HTH domain
VDIKLGAKIKALRLAASLTQEELANRARLTKGFISQLEHDQTSVSVDSLGDLLEALGVSMGEFFADTERQVIFRPSERVEVEGKGAYKFELLVPGSTTNLMDPIMIELKAGQTLGKQGPRPGEQFGYVLKGAVTVRVNRRTYKVPSRSCFYFESDQPNQISNESNGTASILWVTSPPLM